MERSNRQGFSPKIVNRRVTDAVGADRLVDTTPDKPFADDDFHLNALSPGDGKPPSNGIQKIDCGRNQTILSATPMDNVGRFHAAPRSSIMDDIANRRDLTTKTSTPPVGDFDKLS
jgi:hypothetical protein